MAGHGRRRGGISAGFPGAASGYALLPAKILLDTTFNVCYFDYEALNIPVPLQRETLVRSPLNKAFLAGFCAYLGLFLARSKSTPLIRQSVSGTLDWGRARLDPFGPNRRPAAGFYPG